MKKTLISLIVIILISVGFYMYATRPVSAPTQDIQAVSDTLTASSTATLYRVSQTSSKVEFNIHEILSGKPKLVVGTTNQVAGDITVTGSKIVFGAMKLDAKTLKTDSTSRDGALNHMILQTDTPENEYVTFQPSSNDFNGTIVAGQPVTFNVMGNLTISGVTKPATFAVNATVNPDSITGTASTTVSRADFGLKIPNFPFLADVKDQFSVAVTIVADKVTN